MKNYININLLLNDLKSVNLKTGNKTKILSDFLENWIKENLKTGMIKPNELLPTKNILSKELNISLGTVQNIYRSLEDKKIVESKQCVGTIIKGFNEKKSLQKLTSKKDIAVELIKKYIIKNKLQKGMKMPSGRFLSNKLGLSNNIVLLALEFLNISGILKRQSKSVLVILKTNFETNNDQNLTLVEKIEKAIKEYIIKNLKQGDKLPSHKQLAKEFKVSEKTIHESIQPLINNKTLISRRGQYGTVVANMPSDNVLVQQKETSIFANAQDTMFYHYEKTQNIIKKMIIEKYEIGSKLPSIIEMSQLLDVSPNTIRKSFEIIANEGYINFTRGRYGGTFVIDIPDIETTQAYKWLAVDPRFAQVD